MRADIFHNDTFVYSVSGKIAEKKVKDKLKRLLPLTWDTSFYELKRNSVIYVKGYKFTWED